jgi:hypothetical protein
MTKADLLALLQTDPEIRAAVAGIARDEIVLDLNHAIASDAPEGIAAKILHAVERSLRTGRLRYVVRPALVAALTLALSGCALNPFCSVLLAGTGDFCLTWYRINEKPSPHPSIPPVRIPASGGER